MGKPFSPTVNDKSAVARAFAILRTCSVEEVSSVLDRLAEDGRQVFRRGSKALRRASWGRPPEDDSAALDEIALLLENGTARSAEQAAGFVAAQSGHSSFEEATKVRLARKYRKKFGRKY